MLVNLRVVENFAMTVARLCSGMVNRSGPFAFCGFNFSSNLVILPTWMSMSEVMVTALL